MMGQSGRGEKGHPQHSRLQGKWNAAGSTDEKLLDRRKREKVESHQMGDEQQSGRMRGQMNGYMTAIEKLFRV